MHRNLYSSIFKQNFFIRQNNVVVPRLDTNQGVAPVITAESGDTSGIKVRVEAEASLDGEKAGDDGTPGAEVKKGGDGKEGRGVGDDDAKNQSDVEERITGPRLNENERMR